jgi:hypothetical protein
VTAVEKLEAWVKSAPGKIAVCAYGSRVSDLDYLAFGALTFDGNAVWGPEAKVAARGLSCLACVGEEFFDISFSKWPLAPRVLVAKGDYLRNSPVPPVWLRDDLGAEKIFAEWIASHPRDRFTDAQILTQVRHFAIDLKFVQRKARGGIHGRYLLAHVVESFLLNLARQLDLRRGGIGRWRGKDFERTFSPGELELLSLGPVADETAQQLACLKAVFAVKFFLAQLAIPEPPDLW